MLILADATPAVTPDLAKTGWSFIAALLAALVLLTLAFLRGKVRFREMRQPLPGLAATWSFNDSWATNATAVTAVFTGLFGTEDVATAMLGKQATGVLALALVAAATAVGLAGLSPMVLQAMRDDSLSVTRWGLFAAALCTLTATGGQLVAIVVALLDTPLRTYAVIAGIVGGVLLLVYGWRSTRQNLVAGAKPPATADRPGPAVRTPAAIL